MKLEKSGIDALTCPPSQRDKLFFDDDLQGFGIRVTQSGSKTWLLQYRHPIAGVKRMRLGRYPELTPHKARQMAERLRAEVVMGGDPAGKRKSGREEAQRRAEAAELTLGALVKRWDETALRDRRDSYRREAVRAISRAFEKRLKAPAIGLTTQDVQRELDELAKLHPTMARRTHAYGRAAFEWAIRRQLVPSNPFAASVVDGREVSRDRVLSDAELGEAWRAAAEIDAIQGAFVRTAILTLQRRNEVAGMEWAELSQDFATWTIPAERAKNGRAHVVHLAEPMQAVLRGLKPEKGARYVFETYSRKNAGEKAPLNGFSAIMENLLAKILEERAARPKQREKAPMPELDWRLHDFRRTGVTAMARLGVAPHVADRILNHVQGTIRGVAAVYQRHEFLDERKAALNLWGEHVVTAAKIETPKVSVADKSKLGRRPAKVVSARKAELREKMPRERRSKPRTAFASDK